MKSSWFGWSGNGVSEDDREHVHEVTGDDG